MHWKRALRRNIHHTSRSTSKNAPRITDHVTIGLLHVTFAIWSTYVVFATSVVIRERLRTAIYFRYPNCPQSSIRNFVFYWDQSCATVVHTRDELRKISHQYQGEKFKQVTRVISNLNITTLVKAERSHRKLRTGKEKSDCKNRREWTVLITTL